MSMGLAALFWWGMKAFLLLHCLSEEGVDRDKSVETEIVSEEK